MRVRNAVVCCFSYVSDKTPSPSTSSEVTKKVRLQLQLLCAHLDNQLSSHLSQYVQFQTLGDIWSLAELR